MKRSRLTEVEVRSVAGLKVALTEERKIDGAEHRSEFVLSSPVANSETHTGRRL